jgi:tetratricopeptide (TPR) repeat protein
VLARNIKYQMAIGYRLTMNVARAEDLLHQVLSEIELSAVPDQPFRMKVLKDLGAVAMDRGDYETANGYFVTAMEWAKDIGDVSGLISIYNGLAYSHRALGDLDAAASYLQRALVATEVVHDLTSAVVMHNGLAVIAAERGHMQAAYQHADRAIQIARASGPAAYVPHCLNTKAECAAKVGDWELAAVTAHEALELANAVSNDRAAAAARLVLSNVSLHHDDGANAERELQEAAAIYVAIGAKAELGETYMRISRLAGDRGQSKDAHRYATLAYEATKKSTALVGG